MFAQGVAPLVTPERLDNALKEQQNWLTYWGDYTGVHHRDLKQIDTENVKNLRVEWIYQTGETGSNETTPLVVDGVMYLTAGRGIAMPLSMPSTGRRALAATNTNRRPNGRNYR